MVKKTLAVRTAIKIRFGEVDSMGIVWHGNYFKYFEDGREAFGDKYGINYMDFYRNGTMIPLVKVVKKQADISILILFKNRVLRFKVFLNKVAKKRAQISTRGKYLKTGIPLTKGR